MLQGTPIVSAQTQGQTAQFQRRWEPTYHWRSMCSMLLGSPALRAAWPMSSIDFQQPECTDISGHGNHLQAAAVNTVLFGYDPTPGIAPVAEFGGAVNMYLFRADGGVNNWADIQGNEGYILGAQRGLTLGGWFWWAALPGAAQVLMAKDDLGANRQYYISITVGNLIQFAVHPGPVVVNSTATINSGWNHLVGIYDQPSQTIYIVLNGTDTPGGAGAAPAALNDTGAPFTIGADGAGGNRFTGRASDCILCAESLRQGFVRACYHYTQASYGVK